MYIYRHISKYNFSIFQFNNISIYNSSGTRNTAFLNSCENNFRSTIEVMLYLKRKHYFFA